MTLFFTYIDDLKHNIRALVCLFTDDNILYHQIRNKSDTLQLQQDVDNLEKRERKWQRNSTFTSTYHRKEKATNNYTLHSHTFERVSSFQHTLVLRLQKTWSRMLMSKQHLQRPSRSVRLSTETSESARLKFTPNSY